MGLFNKVKTKINGSLHNSELESIDKVADIDIFIENTGNYSEIIAKILKYNHFREIKYVGETEQICPTCKCKLPRMPKKRIICPECKAGIFPRKCKWDEDRWRLFNVAQMKIYDANNLLISGNYDKMIIDSVINSHLYNFANLSIDSLYYSDRWMYLNILDERTELKEAQWHGKIVYKGTQDEIKALTILCDPLCRRGRLMLVSKDPKELAKDIAEAKKQYDQWYNDFYLHRDDFFKEYNIF